MQKQEAISHCRQPPFVGREYMDFETDQHASVIHIASSDMCQLPIICVSDTTLIPSSDLFYVDSLAVNELTYLSTVAHCDIVNSSVTCNTLIDTVAASLQILGIFQSHELPCPTLDP